MSRQVSKRLNKVKKVEALLVDLLDGILDRLFMVTTNYHFIEVENTEEARTLINDINLAWVGERKESPQRGKLLINLHDLVWYLRSQKRPAAMPGDRDLNLVQYKPDRSGSLRDFTVPIHALST